MAANGLELLMHLLGGDGGTDLKSIALGFMIPQLPKIAKQFTTSDQLPGVPGAMGAAPGVAGSPGPEASGIPPQLLPFLALAARAQASQGAPPVPRAMPRVASMDQPLG